MIINAMIVRANANVKTVLTDFLSVPKIIGIGPTMIMPAPRNLAFLCATLRGNNDTCKDNHDASYYEYECQNCKKPLHPLVLTGVQEKNEAVLFNKHSQHTNRNAKN